MFHIPKHREPVSLVVVTDFQDIPHVKNQVYTKHLINDSLHEHTHITEVSIQQFIKIFRKTICPFWIDAILGVDAPALGVEGWMGEGTSMK